MRDFDFKRTTELMTKKSPVVGIIGLGYVGMPTALALTAQKIKVVGIDISAERVALLNKGKSYMKDLKDSDLKKALPYFHATTDFAEAKTCDVVLICVPTPLDAHKIPDMHPIVSACKSLAPHVHKGMLVVLESTTYPGTTEEVVQPILQTNGLRAGIDFDLAFSPERIDPGNKQFTFTEVTKVVGGINEKSGKRVEAFYKLFLPKVYAVSSARTAEMTKIFENIFRLVNISLVNEVKMLSDKMGINFYEVLEAAKTKPYGFMPFYPGPGVGGHCIPLDPFYLSWKAREYNFFTRFIDLAGEINDLMPHHVVTKVIWALNNEAKALRNARVLVLGVAYKKNIDDSRESPAYAIVKDLLGKGAHVTYHDPYIPTFKVRGKTLESQKLTDDLIKKADCVLILTDHSALDYKKVAQKAKMIVDTRGVFGGKKPKNVYL